GLPHNRPVRVQVEHCPDAFYNEEERLRIRNFDPRNQQVALVVRRDFKIAVVPIRGYGSPITARFHYLHAGGATRCQKAEPPQPVIRRPEIETKYVLVFGLNLFLPCEMPDLSGRSMIEVADSRVETANTAESRRQGNLIHRQTSLINELLGKMKASGLSYRERSRSQMSQE